MSSIPGDSSTGASIGVGGTISGSLTFAGDSDWYKAELVSGLDYGFLLSGDGSAQPLVGGDLYVRDADGNSVVSATSSTARSVSVSLSPGTSGSYFVDVRENSGDMGGYRLSWVGNDTIHRNSDTQAVLAVGEKIESAVDVRGDSDWVKVSLKAGLDYGFALSGTGGSGSLTGGDLYVLDENGNRISSATSSSATRVTNTVAISETGTYYLDVRENSGGTGNYALSWLGNDTILRNADTRTVLAAGREIESAVDVAGDSDWIRVTLKAGLHYGFTLSGTGGTSSLKGGDFYILDANGNRLLAATASSATSVSDVLSVDTSGRYFIDVRENSGSTGDYRMSWVATDRVVDNTGTSAVLRDGHTLTGAVDVSEDSDWYAFRAVAGETYTFTLSGTGGGSSLAGTALRLLNGSGNAIDTDSASSGGSVIQWTATGSGLFYLDVSGRGARDIGNFELSVVSNAPVLEGTARADIITGGSGDTRINGYAGNDRLLGGGGSDTLVGGAGADRLIGGAGRDTASYEDARKGVTVSLATPADNTNDAAGDRFSSIENLLGSRYADTLSGNSGRNALDGGSGNDRLYGGRGADALTGGDGADRFSYTDIRESLTSMTGRDRIIDFDRSEGDRIDLRAIDANELRDGNHGFRFIGEDAFSGRAGELRFAERGGTSTVFGDVDGDGRADFAIIVEGVSSLRAGDFFL